MKLPEKIKIGALEYTIIPVNGWLRGKGDMTTGYINAAELEITIRTDIPISNQRTVLMHEIVHAMDWDLCARILTEPKNKLDLETKIDIYANSIVMVLRENPELVKFIMGE